MATGKRQDPYLSFKFKVLLELDGQVVAGFTEVTGLEVETDVEKFRQGGENLFERQLAGPTKFAARLVLKKGITESDSLWAWHQRVTQGEIERKRLSILLLDNIGDEKRRWTFEAALPVKWTGPQFRAGTAEVAFETLELIHNGLIPKS